MINCSCGNEIIRYYPTTNKYKLRTNIVIWEKGRAFCKCLKCKKEIEIPVILKGVKDETKK